MRGEAPWVRLPEPCAPGDPRGSTGRAGVAASSPGGADARALAAPLPSEPPDTGPGIDVSIGRVCGGQRGERANGGWGEAGRRCAGVTATQQRGGLAPRSRTRGKRLVSQWDFVRTAQGAAGAGLGEARLPGDSLLFIWLPVSAIGRPLARSNPMPRCLRPRSLCGVVLGFPLVASCFGYTVSPATHSQGGSASHTKNPPREAELSLWRPKTHVTLACL